MKHILVVEDEEHLAIGIKYNLEAEGYHVTTAGDGPSALEAIAGPEAVDLVVVDLMLPGMSGYDVCEAIRKAGNEVPVLMLSARTLSEDRTRGFDVGADQYLMKPFDLDELLSRVRNLMVRHERRLSIPLPAAEASSTFEFGQARINFDTFQVTVAGEQVRLTSLQIKLLKYFVENTGRVVGRDELLEHVWGFNSSPTTRTVDQFVHELRQVFEEDPAAPRYFLTVRGAGYRFVPSGEATG